MYRTVLLGLLLLAGCRNVSGPFGPREVQRADDPLLPIAEQQRRGRSQYALPEESTSIVPQSGVRRPGVHDR